jgi:hypothetical protein
MPQATCLVSPAVSLDRIPPRVRRFVAEHIQSVTQLELLLLLHGDPAMERTAEEWGHLALWMKWPKRIDANQRP